tara:strand:+ start:3944 stop:5104 length:1161 start_codon:yes stop_codon:yes gene_type:complete
MIQSVAIIGAGISGLTAGCALRNYGLEVDIFERSDSISEYGAGITLSRNATSLLRHLDLYDELENYSYKPKGSYIRHYKSAKNIAYLDFTLDFLAADRRDVVKIFSERFVGMGGHLHLSQTIESTDPERGKLFVSGGGVHSADLILACDGIKSIIREKEFDSTEPRFTNCIAWRGVVDGSNFPKFTGDDQVNIYHGPGGHVVHYPIGHEDKINFVAIETKQTWEEESWKKEGNKRNLSIGFEGWNMNIQEIFKGANKVYKWGLFDRVVPAKISKGKAVLLGDAAHPMVPFLGQGGCLAIEDAFTLAFLVNRFKDDLDRIKDLYQILRHTRAILMQQRSNFQGKFNHISNPFLMALRNMAVKLFVKVNTDNVHSYDALKEISKVIKS